MMLTPKLPQIDWLMMAPLTLMAVTGIVALIIELLQPRRNNNLIVGASLFGLVLTFASLAYQLGMPTGDTFGKMVLRNQGALLLQMVIVASTFLVFLFSDSYLRQRRIPWAEFYPLAIWSAFGGMIMVSTENLLMMFLGLETLSIALYCMAGMAREEQKSEESALKYFLLGAFASAFLLLGIAFVYGGSGTIDIGVATEFGMSIPGALSTYVQVGVLLIIIGLAFKMGLAPFHQWTPDVYQGAPTNVTAFMASVSKTAAVGMLIPVLGLTGGAAHWIIPLAFLAGLSMIVGNAAALVQRDVKRVLGYSSVANAGYILLALLCTFAAPDKVSFEPVYFFLMGYAVTVVGSFAVVSLAAKNGSDSTRFEDLHGFWKRSPLAAGVLVVCIASQIGIPPTVGFFGKALIFKAALDASAVAPVLFWLAIILAVTSAMSAAYYLQIIRAMFVAEDSPVTKDASDAGPSVRVSLGLCAAMIFGLALVIGPVLAYAPPRGSTPKEIVAPTGPGSISPSVPNLPGPPGG
jgi:NADH-quinone oxidoreductase subunit N